MICIGSRKMLSLSMEKVRGKKFHRHSEKGDVSSILTFSI